jgi:2-dehydro-3-deoxygalactonokinase
MAEKPAFIGVDWGTSNGRFLLIGHDGSVLGEARSPGIGQIDGADQIETICFEVIADWLTAFPDLPVIMTGMAGSNIGWHLASYAPTPATFGDIAANMLTFNARTVRFSIAPGLSTMRGDGLPDYMRGEEVQIFGAIGPDEALVCLPGTHSKWARVQSGVVTQFHTAPTGELIDVIGRHSILLNPKRPVRAIPGPAFTCGAETAKQSEIGLESLLISVRNLQIAEQLPADDAQNYLAGLIIGCEIKSAISIYGQQKPPIMLVGAPQLTALYDAALISFGASSRQVNGNSASVLGLMKLFTAQQIKPG